MKKKIVVVGANGQLGCCIRELVEEYQNFEFYFFSSKELDITIKKAVLDVLSQNNFDYCVNCAAYTAVDKAEIETEKAYEVNVLGVENLAIACKKNNVELVHISTDFVFDGKSKKPYTEESQTNPISIYGQTKLDGENRIIDIMDNYIIIRTSWLFSKYNENFMNKMLTLSAFNDKVKVVYDQTGSPTSACDLARTVLTILDSGLTKHGIYNYCNEGVTNWFEFAKAIFKTKGIKTEILPVKSKEFNSIAKRPMYSALDCSKIKNDYLINILDWRISLNQIID